MTKLRRQILAALFLCNCFLAVGQGYPLHLRGVDIDSASIVASLGLQTAFDTRTECVAYVNKLTGTLQSRGYVTASIDSIVYDSTFARIVLFIGKQYRWVALDTRQVDPSVLDAIGWRDRQFIDKPMDFSPVQDWQEKILTYMENHGYPFARVYVDSLQMDSSDVSASMKLDKGPYYKFDSIRVHGEAKISNEFLQRYLDIRNGSTFSKEKLMRISRRLRELPYVEEEYPARLVWLNSGAILDLYLKQKQSSQVNVLVGFLPNNDQLSSKKMLITGEANLRLRNALGVGETIGLNWQQLQVKSPRLNIVYQHPFLFNTPIGLDFAFDMFRKDSSFLNVNFRLGGQYNMDINQSVQLFLQRFQTIVTDANTNYIIQHYKLPEDADVSSTGLGIDYQYNNTNYRLNPVRGNDLRIVTSAGTKKIKKNSEVLELKDPANPSFDFGSLYDTVKLNTYQFRIQGSAAKYFPIGTKSRSTLKTALNGGIFQSGNIFRNELFQIGGYRLLRGFDEESQYLSQYIVGTLEYRYLVGQNSFFYAFSDGGWGRNNSQDADISYTYLSGGLGLAFETKLGIFNLAWAVGKRSDTPFNLRQSKIHFGFVNYF